MNEYRRAQMLNKPDPMLLVMCFGGIFLAIVCIATAIALLVSTHKPTHPKPLTCCQIMVD